MKDVVSLTSNNWRLLDPFPNDAPSLKDYLSLATIDVDWTQDGAEVDEAELRVFLPSSAVVEWIVALALAVCLI